MRHFSESIQIAADPSRVWQALTIPEEVVCWDTGIIEALDAPSDYPSAGQHVRWRYRLGPLSLVLHDRPTLVEAVSTFASSIRLGPFDFEETYTLRRIDTASTELTADLSLVCRVPIFGQLAERIAGQPLARTTVRSSLAAIKCHCEKPPVSSVRS